MCFLYVFHLIIGSLKALVAFSAPEICRIQQRFVHVAGSSSHPQTRGKGAKASLSKHFVLSWSASAFGRSRLCPAKLLPISIQKSSKRHMKKTWKVTKTLKKNDNSASPKTPCTVTKGCTVLRYLSTLSGPSPRSSMVDASPPTASAHA